MAQASHKKHRPHAVFMPFPLQGHITPTMQLAKLLHHRGFYVTFVNTEYNHKRLIQSGNHESDFFGIEDFKFETVLDGLPTTTQDIPTLCEPKTKDFLEIQFRNLLMKLNESRDNPPVTCVICDGSMSFPHKAAIELGLPAIFFRAHSACGFWAYAHFKDLIGRGYLPLRDESQLTNGYLDTKIEFIPGMTDLRLRDMPSFIRTLDLNNTMLNHANNEAQAMFNGTALVINTFAEFEPEVLEAIKTQIPQVFAIGPLLKLSQNMTRTELSSINSNLWKEDGSCLEWLDKHNKESVIYVNFGSIAVMNPQQLIEFAWGLSDSKNPFLWVIRPDQAEVNSILLDEFKLETEQRGLLVSWCSQEKVLAHPSVGAFVTHTGWNSTIECMCSAGVPMICWPFLAEQPTNCRYACTKWCIGMEIEGEVKRESIEGLVREMMSGEKGREMREKAKGWKKAAELAVQPGGSSYTDFERLLSEVLRNWSH